MMGVCMHVAWEVGSAGTRGLRGAQRAFHDVSDVTDLGEGRAGPAGVKDRAGPGLDLVLGVHI